ncbi:MAG TPA: hypothetical protein PKD11_14090, partial [Pyrinomonadaceae bacterium]|nr:hypothetical protein [Pyrinomonadaceae bacterium]
KEVSRKAAKNAKGEGGFTQSRQERKGGRRFHAGSPRTQRAKEVSRKAAKNAKGEGGFTQGRQGCEQENYDKLRFFVSSSS